MYAWCKYPFHPLPLILHFLTLPRLPQGSTSRWKRRRRSPSRLGVCRRLGQQPRGCQPHLNRRRRIRSRKHQEDHKPPTPGRQIEGRILCLLPNQPRVAVHQHLGQRFANDVV